MDTATGDVTPVSVLGIMAVEAGAAITRGQAVQSDASACAVPQTAATAGDTAAGISAGIALDDATAAGGVIRILRGGVTVLHPDGFT